MKKKIENFGQKFRKTMGKRYKRLRKEDRKIIEEMDRCQQKGGAVGTATTWPLSKK